MELSKPFEPELVSTSVGKYIIGFYIHIYTFIKYVLKQEQSSANHIVVTKLRTAEQPIAGLDGFSNSLPVFLCQRFHGLL